MSIKLEGNTKHFIKQLGKTAGMLQVVAAETLNESAEEINKAYKLRLKKNARLRNKFSLNSVKIFKANPLSRSGEPRPIQKLDALVGVRKMRGGKEHYLKKLEDGGTLRGNPMTRGKVPIPLKSSRTSENINKPIAGKNRITRGKTQTLKINGSKIGVRGDRYKSTSARWGSVYRAVRSGKIQGDMKKPFYFIDNRNKEGIFLLKRNKIRKIRRLDKNVVKRKAEPHFKKSVSQVTPQRIQKRFVKKAKSRF